MVGWWGVVVDTLIGPGENGEVFFLMAPCFIMHAISVYQSFVLCDILNIHNSLTDKVILFL